MWRWIVATVVATLVVLAFVINRAAKDYGPVGIGREVVVTHGFYQDCEGVVIGSDENGCFWIDAWCDGESRGKLLFTRDFLRRTK